MLGLEPDGVSGATSAPSGRTLPLVHARDVVLSAESSDPLVVPSAELLFQGEYSRNAFDLIVQDGSNRLVVHDYFRPGRHPDLVSPEGASLSGSVIDSLTLGPQGERYAQVGAPAAPKAIGRVESVGGGATAIRNGLTVVLAVGDLVYKGDTVQTDRGGSLALALIDGTTFSLASSARMVLNEMVYQAGASGNTSLLSLVQGSISFVAGQVAKTGDMRVDTPVATMGIRGTAVIVDITADNGSVRFSVVREPDGTVGSYVLYNRTTGAPLSTVASNDVSIVISNQGVISQVTKTAAENTFDQGTIARVFDIARTAASNPIPGAPASDVQTPGAAPVAPPAPPAAPTPGRTGDSPLASSGTSTTLTGAADRAPVNGGGSDGSPPPPPPAGTAASPTVTAAQALGAAQTQSTGPGAEPQTVEVSRDEQGRIVATPVVVEPAATAPETTPGTTPGTTPVVVAAPPLVNYALSVAANEGVAVSERDLGVLGRFVVGPDGVAARQAPVGERVTSVVALTGADTASHGVSGSATAVGRYGVLVLNQDGSYGFLSEGPGATALPERAVGTDRFRFTETDGQGGEQTGELTLNVVGRNDAPTAVSDLHAVVVQADATVFATSRDAGVLFDDTDPDTGETATLQVAAAGAATGSRVGLGADGATVQGLYGTLLIRADGTYRYTADHAERLAAGASAIDRFTYTASDGRLGSTAFLDFEVAGADDAPVGVADSLVLGEDAGATIVDVLANDPDSDGGPKRVASVGAAQHGRVAIAGDGTGVSYRPDADFSGTDSFTYRLNGGGTATVTVVVTPIDDAPIAVADVLTILEGAGSTPIDVLANDTDIDGGPKSIATVGAAAHGSVSLAKDGAGAIYTPDATFAGLDGFTYRLNGGGTATVTVVVTPVDDAPVAVADLLAIREGAGPTPIDVLANDTDIDGGPKIVAAIGSAPHGSVSIAEGGAGVIYTPDATFAGLDGFTYRLNGGGTTSVTVMVTPVDDAPVAVADVLAIRESAGPTLIDVLANDTDIDGGPKIVAAVGSAPHGSVSIAEGGAGVIYTPDANFAGLDGFTYRLNGGGTATVTVVVTARDGPPVAGLPIVGAASEGSGPTIIDLVGSSFDPEGRPLGIADLVWIDDPGRLPAGFARDGTVLRIDTDSPFFDALRAGESFVARFGYRLTDGGGVSTPQTAIVTIAGRNDAPVLDPDAGSPHLVTERPGVTGSTALNPFPPLTGTLTFRDPDRSDTHALTVVTARLLDAGGTDLAAALGFTAAQLGSLLQLTLQDNAGGGTIGWSWAVQDRVLDRLPEGTDLRLVYGVGVADGTEAASRQDIVFLLRGANDAPTIVVANPAPVPEGNAGTAMPVTVRISDQVGIVDPDVGDPRVPYVPGTLAFASVPTGHAPTGGTLAGLFTLDAANGTIGYDRAAFDYLAAGDTVTATFGFMAASGSDSQAKAIAVTITGRNDAPVVTSAAQIGSVDQATPQSGFDSGRIVAADPDRGAVLSYAVGQGTTTGSASHAGSNAFSLDGLRIVRNGFLFYDDPFDDPAGAGNHPPPAGPDFPNGNTGTYSVGGSFAEGGGRLSPVATGTSIGLGGASTFISSSALLESYISPADPTRGLRSDDDFSVEARFDLSTLPADPRQAFGIRLTDITAGGAGQPPNVGQNVVELTVRRGTDGVLRAELRQVSFVGGGSSELLDSFRLLPAAGDDQIVLRLSHSVAASATDPGAILASFDYRDGGSSTGSHAIATPGHIFGHAPGSAVAEDWTRAQIVSYAPARSDTLIQGTYGRLDLSQAGEWYYHADPANAAVRALAAGEALHDVFHVTIGDGLAAVPRTIDVAVRGLNDLPEITAAPGDSAGGVAVAGGGVVTGTLTVSDRDVTDVVSVSVQGVVRIDGSGTEIAFPPALTQNQHAAITSAFTVPLDAGLSGAATSGHFTWTFGPDAGIFAFLAAGEVLRLKYILHADDGHVRPEEGNGAVVIEVTGVNDAPISNDDRIVSDMQTTLSIPQSALTFNDSDRDFGALLSVGGVSSIGTAGSPPSIDPSQRFVVLGTTTVGGFTGNASDSDFTYTVKDEQGAIGSPASAVHFGLGGSGGVYLGGIGDDILLAPEYGHGAPPRTLTLTGNAGRDVFVLNNAYDDVTISDLQEASGPASGDVVDISRLMVGGRPNLVPTSGDIHDYGLVQAADESLDLVYAPGGGGSAQVLAHLPNLSSLSSHEVLLIWHQHQDVLTYQSFLI